MLDVRRLVYFNIKRVLVQLAMPEAVTINKQNRRATRDEPLPTLAAVEGLI